MIREHEITKPFQRKGSRSNTQVGKRFEVKARLYFENQGIVLKPGIKIDIGVGSVRKPRSFDLGCDVKKIIVECKSLTWTKSDNAPSSKISSLNEAMFYFLLSPREFRKILFVSKCISKKRGESLAKYYIRTMPHLIPEDVEIWEYDETSKSALRLNF